MINFQIYASADKENDVLHES